MTSNVLTLLIAYVILLWISCEAVPVQNGDYLRDVKIHSNVYFQSVPGLVRDRARRQKSVISFDDLMHLLQNTGITNNGDYDVDERNHVLRYSPKRSKLDRENVFISKPREKKYDDSIIGNKDLVTRTGQKSIQREQTVSSSGQNSAKDGNLFDEGYSGTHTYTGRNHGSKDENAPRQILLSSASLSSFDGISTHKSSPGQEIVNGGAQPKIESEFQNDISKHLRKNNEVISRDQRKTILLREKRSERENVPPIPDNGLTDNLNSSVTHTWPDNISRAGNHVSSDNSDPVTSAEKELGLTTISSVVNLTSSNTANLIPLQSQTVPSIPEEKDTNSTSSVPNQTVTNVQSSSTATTPPTAEPSPEPQNNAGTETTTMPLVSTSPVSPSPSPTISTVTEKSAAPSAPPPVVVPVESSSSTSVPTLPTTIATSTTTTTTTSEPIPEHEPVKEIENSEVKDQLTSLSPEITSTLKPEPNSEPESEPADQSTNLTNADLGSEGIPKSEPTSVPKSEPASVPNSVPASEPTSTPEAEPKIESATEPKIEPTSVPKSEPASEPKPTSEPKGKPVSEPKSEPISEPTSVPESEPTSVPKSEPSSVPISEPKSEPTAIPTSEPKSEPATVPISEPKSESVPVPTSEPKSEPATVPIGEPKSESVTVPTSEPKTEPVSETTVIATSKPEVKPSPEPVPVSETEPILKSSAEPTIITTVQQTKTEITPKTIPEATAETSAKSPTSTHSEAEPVSVKPISEPIPIPSAESTNGIPMTELKTKSFPEPTRHPKTSAESYKDVDNKIPMVFLPEADETIPDEITKISINSSGTNGTSEPEASTKTTETAEPSTTGSSEITVPSEPIPSTTLREPEPASETTPPGAQEPEPEPSSPEPEGEDPDAPSETTPVSVAEPGPDWEDAKKKWSIAWEIHLYMLGGIFAIVAVYTLASMVKLYQINRLLSKKYFITLNLLICLLCSLRAAFLLIDGYNANGTFHPVVNYLLYSTAFPCLTSAFSILLYALLQATQMRLVPPRVQKIQILITIIFCHFVLQMTTDILVGMYAGMAIMLFVCQLVFICWGLFLFIGYAYIFRYLYTSAVKRQKNYQYMLTGKQYPTTGESYKHKFTLSLAVKVTFMAAILGLVTIGLEIYAIVGVYGVFSDKKPDPWPWWLYHTALRLVECCMCIIMAYVASQPFRYREVKSCGFMCAPCLEICTCADKDEQSDKLGWSEYDRLYMTTNKRTNGHTNGKKKKIYLNEGTDIVPIVIQPSTTEESRPPSMLIIEDGYVRFQAETDINKIVDNYSKTHAQEMSTFTTYDGIINGAYIRSVDDTVRFQEDVASQDGYTRKSRKSSLASSGFFRPPSSISLADSMESEIDKAFRSMHEDGTLRKKRSSSHSLPSQGYSIDDNIQGSTIEAYIDQVRGHPATNLRRSRSALGDLNIHRPDSWSKKLFRSRSDGTGGIRTKDLDHMRYMSLLDLEKEQERIVTFAGETIMHRDSKSSESSNDLSRSSSQEVVKRLLKKETSEPDEIDV